MSGKIISLELERGLRVHRELERIQKEKARLDDLVCKRWTNHHPEDVGTEPTSIEPDAS